MRTATVKALLQYRYEYGRSSYTDLIVDEVRTVGGASYIPVGAPTASGTARVGELIEYTSIGKSNRYGMDRAH